MNLLLQYPRIVFFTGAGMSKESGMPTYRGEGGLWAEYRYQDYACQQAFERDPMHVWEFHEQRRAKASSCQPHQGHHLLARFIQERRDSGKGENGGVTVVTQNIDGLHQRSGVMPVYELHGSLWRVRCDVCAKVLDQLETPLPNYRHNCGAYLRPDIVWFGDALDRGLLTKVVDAISHCNLFVSVGTSAAVFPAARLPLQAIEAGARLIEINPRPTPVSQYYQTVMRGPGSEMLAKLFEAGTAE